MSTVAVYSFTQSATYVTDNVLKSLKDVIRLSGLSPEKLVSSWDSKHRAIKTWLESRHLERVELEIYNPVTDALILRWDLDIVYQWSDGDGSFYTDTEQLKYAIKKSGVAPESANYQIFLKTKPGRPDVAGWGPCANRSTEGMVRQALGSTVEHSGLGASAAYWRHR